MPNELTRPTAMLNGFLSAFARAIIRRRDDELSVDGCKGFGNSRLSTEGFAGDAFGAIDDAARRCSTQGVDLSTLIDLCAFLCGTRMLQMIYARILWFTCQPFMRLDEINFCLPPRPTHLDHGRIRRRR